jgi:hypothetical protein
VSAAIAFGIEHKVQVITIASNTASASGRCSAEGSEQRYRNDHICRSPAREAE